MQTSEFNRRMKYAFMNDDPFGVLSSIYDNDVPHPYFNPKNIAFTKLRNFDHSKFVEREKSSRTIIWEDLEYIMPGNEMGDMHCKDGSPACIETDYLIKSCITTKDHLWPCKYTFSSWHLINTSMSNIDVKLTHKPTRPYFANCLFGNRKEMRGCFYDLLKANNQLENNLVNLFKVYKSSYIDEGQDDIDKFFRNIELKEYVNTAINDFNGAPTFTSHLISKHIEEATWISVVAETLEVESLFFPTEKVGKPMMCNKPFIILSGKNYLKMLRNIGFKTFHPIIDESYDEIDDSIERTKSAFESFNKLQKLDPLQVRQQLKEVLDYNESHMRDKLWLSRNARELIDPLTTDI